MRRMLWGAIRATYTAEEGGKGREEEEGDIVERQADVQVRVVKRQRNLVS
jgi:hypothetical protein